MGDKVTSSARHRPFVKTKAKSGSEDVHYSVVYEDLPEEFKLVAERELDETESNRKRGLQQLKEYMRAENLPPICDDSIVAILRVCKYNTKKSKAKLKRFVAFRKELVKLMAELGMEKIQHIIDDISFGFLPYRDKQGRAIFHCRCDTLNEEKYNLKDVVDVLLTMGLFYVTFQLSSVTGIVFFGECQTSSFYLFCRCLNEGRKNMLRVINLPLRVARVEIVHENAVTRCFLKFVRAVLSEKIIGRIILHGSELDALHEYYHPDILPEEFGGNMGPISNESYRQKFLDFIRDLIKEAP